MSIAEALLVAVLAAAFVGTVFLLLARRTLGVRDTGAGVVDRLREVEAELAPLREAKAKAEEAVAIKSEALVHGDRLVAELRERLDHSARASTEALAQVSSLASEKASLEAVLHASGRDAAARQDELRSRLDHEQTRSEALRRELSALQAANTELAAGQARLGEALDQERKKVTERLDDLREQKERLRTDFKEVAQQVLGQGGEALSKQHDVFLAPLREQITKFEAELRQAHVDSSRDREGLRAHIQLLASNGAEMITETRQLTQALRNESQTQGAWGERLLETILDESGLREGHEYVTQASHTTEEGRRLRPDVLVNLPEGKSIVVDSKVSLTAYTDCVNEVDLEARSAHIARHVASLRGHIKDLSRKNYAQLSDAGLNFVLLFVPIEGALAAAIQHDPHLTSAASEQNVFIVTPTTLLTTLRMIATLWRVERRNKNAEEIAARAGALFDKFAGFAEEFLLVGKQLGTTRASYESAMAKLRSGRGNLVRQVEMLQELGAKTTKALPRQLTAEASAELADENVEDALVM